MRMASLSLAVNIELVECCMRGGAVGSCDSPTEAALKQRLLFSRNDRSTYGTGFSSLGTKKGKIGQPQYNHAVKHDSLLLFLLYLSVLLSFQRRDLYFQVMQ